MPIVLKNTLAYQEKNMQATIILYSISDMC